MTPKERARVEANRIVREWRLRSWRACIPQSFYADLIDAIAAALEKK